MKQEKIIPVVAIIGGVGLTFGIFVGGMIFQSPILSGIGLTIWALSIITILATAMYNSFS